MMPYRALDFGVLDARLPAAFYEHLAHAIKPGKRAAFAHVSAVDARITP